ncbi:hypothetical protein GCM10023339_25830 [Alloalcanivorax gelatiniphagus]
MLITESLFLLMRRDDGKAEVDISKRHYGLTAAVITDLVIAQRIALSDDKDPRVTVLVPAPPGHAALDPGMARLQKRDGTRLSWLVNDTKIAVEDTIARSLVSAGTIGVEERRAFGLVPARYPVIDPGPERRLRERLRAVLHGEVPDPQESAVLAILQGLGIVEKVLAEEKGDLGKKELEARIEEVSADVRAGDAVARAVAAMNAAIMTAVVVPATVSGGGD